MEAPGLYTDSLINFLKTSLKASDLVSVIQGFPFNYHIFQINKYYKYPEFVSTLFYFFFLREGGCMF